MNIRKPCFPQIVIATVVSLIGLPQGLPAWLQTELPSQVERQQFSGTVPANGRLSFWIQAASSLLSEIDTELTWTVVREADTIPIMKLSS
jgi:hypothetical protein